MEVRRSQSTWTYRVASALKDHCSGALTRLRSRRLCGQALSELVRKIRSSHFKKVATVFDPCPDW